MRSGLEYWVWTWVRVSGEGLVDRLVLVKEI